LDAYARLQLHYIFGALQYVPSFKLYSVSVSPTYTCLHFCIATHTLQGKSVAQLLAKRGRRAALLQALEHEEALGGSGHSLGEPHIMWSSLWVCW
jgi:hypothetical protein